MPVNDASAFTLPTDGDQMNRAMAAGQLSGGRALRIDQLHDGRWCAELHDPDGSVVIGIDPMPEGALIRVIHKQLMIQRITEEHES